MKRVLELDRMSCKIHLQDPEADGSHWMSCVELVYIYLVVFSHFKSSLQLHQWFKCLFCCFKRTTSLPSAESVFLLVKDSPR